MINPIQPNAGVRATENVSSVKGSPAASNESSQDVAEVSQFGQAHESYMSMLRALPDVRPEVVDKAKNVTNSIAYPPLEIVSGIGNLVGNPHPSDAPKEGS